MKPGTGLKKTKLPKENHIVFVLDNSASMVSIQESIRELYNEQLLAHVEGSKIKNSGLTYASLILFGEHINKVFEHKKLDELTQLMRGDYAPCEGRTAMYDGIGSAIELLSKYENNLVDQSFVVITLTDGHTNHVIRYDQHTLSKLTTAKESTDRWSFVTMGANIDVNEVAAGFGSNQISNRLSWAPTSSGVKHLSASLYAGTTSFYSDRSGGATSKADFFDPNAA